MQLFTINATPERYDVTEAENLTRHKNYAMAVSNVLSNFGIDGFTIQEVQGFWQGVAEQSYIITVAIDDDTNSSGQDARATIEMIAEELRLTYNQDAVMVTYPNGSAKLIERP